MEATEHADQSQRVDPIIRRTPSNIARPTEQPAASVGNAPLSPSAAVALQRTVGNAAVRSLIHNPPQRPTVQRGITNWIGDVLNARYNEKERDEYEDAVSDLESFKKKPVTKDRNETSTGSGLFDLSYAPGEGRLTITVRCHFDFRDSVIERIVDPKSDPAAPKMKDIVARWDDGEKAAWMNKFFAQASTTWKDTHTFWCQRDWWESLRATTSVRFVNEPETNPFKYHFNVVVHKRGSIEKGPAHTVGARKRQAEWGEELLDDNPKGQPTGAHEAGHMLGLGDEYTGGAAGPILHDNLVKAQFGKELIQGKGDPASIMADGAKVLPEHGVTFFEALERLTPDLKWARDPKPPRPKPATSPDQPATSPPGAATTSSPAAGTGQQGVVDPSSQGSAGGVGSAQSGSPPGYGSP
jgi:hypothetical protein